MVDIGVPPVYVENCLQRLHTDAAQIAVLVTHAHSDHIKYVPDFLEKQDAHAYVHYRTGAALNRKQCIRKGSITEFGEGDFFVGDITVSPFPLSHDIPCVGYSFYHMGQKISVATDLGHAGQATMDCLQDSDAVLIEANHDVGLLKANRHYPPFLKHRILSEKGHLSNQATAAIALELVKGRTKRLILGHLSKENNYPELAYHTVLMHLRENGYGIGTDLRIDVARQDRMSAVIELDREPEKQALVPKALCINL